MTMTMQRITVPAAFVESTGGGEFKWPATSYAGTIRAVRISQPKMGDKLWAGFESMDAEQISLEVGNLEVLEATSDQTAQEISESVGDRPYFIQFTVRDGSNTFENVDPTERNATNWQLQRGLRDFVRLAQALGAVETDTDGNLTPDMSLLDELNNDGGDVLGTQIGFSVVHNKRGYANLGSIFSVD